MPNWEMNHEGPPIFRINYEYHTFAFLLTSKTHGVGGTVHQTVHNRNWIIPLLKVTNLEDSDNYM